MFKVTFQLGNLKALERALPQLSKVIDDEIRRAVTEAAKVATEEIKKRTPETWGRLKRSIGFNVFQVDDRTVGRISTEHEYAPYVEYGTLPHFPPVKEIQPWVETKLGVDKKQSKSIAFLIARKIAKFGTKGAHMFRDGAKAALPKIKRVMHQSIKKALLGLK